jgi:hypothetical protein
MSAYGKIFKETWLHVIDIYIKNDVKRLIDQTIKEIFDSKAKRNRGYVSAWSDNDNCWYTNKQIQLHVSLTILWGYVPKQISNCE